MQVDFHYYNLCKSTFNKVAKKGRGGVGASCEACTPMQCRHTSGIVWVSYCHWGVYLRHRQLILSFCLD